MVFERDCNEKFSCGGGGGEEHCRVYISGDTWCESKSTVNTKHAQSQPVNTDQVDILLHIPLFHADEKKHSELFLQNA